MNIFSAENLTCSRGGRTVFTDLDFTLQAGGVLVLVGPNGSGKSSLLRLMAGLLKPESGNIKWDAEAINEDPERHGARLHYVGHHDAIKPALSVLENVSFWASLMNGGSARVDSISTALETLGIGHLEKVPGRLLSAGQKRRANLARVLATPAPLWLLDEPTTALDKETIKRLETTINHHCAGGGMVVISTHSDMQLGSHQTINLASFAEILPMLEHAL